MPGIQQTINPDLGAIAGKLEASLASLIAWVETHRYQGYDPGDGNSSFLHRFTFNKLLLERLLQQAVYRAPVNLRPLLGIRPHVSTKGMGYMAWGYLKMFGVTGDTSYRDRAVKCLEWLIENRAPRYTQFCWGNHFPFSSRGGRMPALEPSIVWSGLIGQAFLEAYERLGSSRYLEVAASICEWILKLPRESTESGDCISYVMYRQNSIHNSNMLGAALLARVGTMLKNPEALEVAQAAMEYSCSRQNPDGSWYYGDAPTYHWIDNFHTGYNLDSLKRYRDATGNRQYDEQLHRGFEYFWKHFFLSNGCPKYYHNKTYPIDIQCAAQAIDSLTFFAVEYRDALPLAAQVAGWTVDHMQDKDGHFYYRDFGWVTNKTPMLHWGQGTMCKALAHLLSAVVAHRQPLERPVTSAGR